MSGFKLIVGLGNPGREYEATRHNAGFWWVADLAAQHRVALNSEAKFHAYAGRMPNNGADIWLLLPQTFMNLSGRSVSALARFYKILPEEILVVHDELDLPPGDVKLKKGGGAGGHNGLKDIAAQIGTQNFWRLRIGIGHPGDRAEVVNYVLNAPRKEELGLIHDAITRSFTIWPLLASGELSDAMKKLHTKPPTTLSINESKIEKI